MNYKSSQKESASFDKRRGKAAREKGRKDGWKEGMEERKEGRKLNGR